MAGYHCPLRWSASGSRFQAGSASEKDVFRYLGAARRETIPAEGLEDVIDDFVLVIVNRIQRRQLRNTNLHAFGTIWRKNAMTRNIRAFDGWKRNSAATPARHAPPGLHGLLASSPLNGLELAEVGVYSSVRGVELQARARLARAPTGR